METVKEITWWFFDTLLSIVVFIVMLTLILTGIAFLIDIFD